VPILTKDPITKGSPATFTLDKAALALVASVANSTYYADTANWKSVVIIYKSDTGNQSKKVTFDVSGAGPYTAPFYASIQSKDVFDVSKILILDYDGGNHPVYSSELTVGEFDIDMGVIVIPVREPSFGFAYDETLGLETYAKEDVTALSVEIFWEGIIIGTAPFIGQGMSASDGLGNDYTVEYSESFPLGGDGSYRLWAIARIEVI
jgi:hypothetical protein